MIYSPRLKPCERTDIGPCTIDVKEIFVCYKTRVKGRTIDVMTVDNLIMSNEKSITSTMSKSYLQLCM